jgi:WD40 repeat protein
VADVFISYSRRDAAFVERVQRELEARGKSVWVDVEGIRDAEVFPVALLRAIEGSDSFVFVITPESVRSPFCAEEVSHAVELNKRIVPLALRDVPEPQIPEAIRVRHWIPMRDGEFDRGVKRLVTAIDTDLGWEHRHTRLTVKALEWEQAGGDRSFLLRGSELAAAERWLAAGVGKDPGPTVLEQEYLLAARSARTRRQRLLAGGSLSVAAVAVGLLIFALISRGQAITAARVALAGRLGAEAVSEPRLDVAMLMAREAASLDRSPQTESTLLATLLRSPAVIGTIALPVKTTAALAFSPDARTLAAIDGLGELRLFDSRTHALAARPPLPELEAGQAPAYSSDGTLLAFRGVLSSSSFIQVSDARTLQPTVSLAEPATMPEAPREIPGGSVTIAPDDRMLYYPYWRVGIGRAPVRAYVQRWALPGGEALPVVRIGSQALLAIRLIDAGSRLLTVSADNVKVFDGRSLRLLRTVHITPAPTAPAAAAISPDGATAVMGSRTGSVSFIDTSTGTSRVGAQGQGASVARVLYAPDGSDAVSISSNGNAIVWNPGTARPDEVLIGPAGQVDGAAISPDGDTLYTSSLHGLLLEWDLAGGQQFGRRAALGATVPCCAQVSPPASPLAVSPDGSRFAARTGPSTVGLFSSSTLNRLTSFRIGHKGNVITALAWSTGGELAVGAHAGLVQLWSTAGAPRLVHSLLGLRSLAAGQPEAIQSIAFSHDGRLVAASDDDKAGSIARGASGSLQDLPSLAIWQVASGRLVTSPSVSMDYVPQAAGDDLLAFSPNDKLLALSTFDRNIQILDPSTGETRQAFTSVAGTTALTFAPDGTLANGTPAGTVELWNPVTGKQISGSLDVGTAPVTSIAFDPTGRLFATGSRREGTAKLWFTAALQQQGAALSTDPGTTSTAVFEPGGARLLAVNDHGDAFTWPMSLTAWEHQACAVAGRNLSRQEWSILATGRPYSTVCPRQ